MSIAQRSGKISRLNDKIVPLISDDQNWRVAYALLHRVMDVTAVELIAGQVGKAASKPSSSTTAGKAQA